MSRRFVMVSMVLCAGCAYRTPKVQAPASLPGFEVTDVIVTDETNAIDDAAEADVRSRTKETLERAVKPGAARASVRVAIASHDDNIYARSVSQDGCAAFGMIGVPAGQVIDRETVIVDVAIVEPDGRTHRGWALVEKEGSLYAPASKRALAAALDRALASAAND